MTLTIPANLDAIELRNGCGSGRDGDRCAIQEYRAWAGLDPKPDTCPDDVCPVIHRLIIALNDARPEWRKALVSRLPKLAGSRGSDALRMARAFACADEACRVFAPAALDSAGLKDEAAKLRALTPITDRESAAAARWAAAAAAADARWAAAAAAAARWAAADAAAAARWAAATAAAAAVAAADAVAAARWAADADAKPVDPLALLDRLLAMTDAA